MAEKLRAGIIGATGMVGQRFITLINNHPYFEISALAASPNSAGKKYADAVANRWKLKDTMPPSVADMIVMDASEVDKVAALCDFVFCATDMKKEETIKLEEAYAKAETPVVSNNSVNRGKPDVPMMLPEINSSHTEIIESQRKRLGTKSGFIAVKPNCSIQSYVPMLTPFYDDISEVVVSTYQAISGAGKSFADWEEMIDNVIPYIGGGEEEKSEKEPLKIWGRIENGEIVNIKSPVITAHCIRVPVTDGHLASVFFKFKEGKKLSKEEILNRWKNYSGEPQKLGLPSAPKQFIHYFEEIDRPQTRFDRDLENGMAISAGRLQEDTLFDYKFIGLSHNTLRGAAGGAVLTAELLYKKGYINKK